MTMRRAAAALLACLMIPALSVGEPVPTRNMFQGAVQSDIGLMCSNVAAGGNAWTFQPCTAEFDTARPYASGLLFRWRGDPDSDSTFEQLATCDWRNAWQFGGYDDDADGTVQYATMDIKGVFVGSAGGTTNSRAVTLDAHQVITSGGLGTADHIAVRGRSVGHGTNNTGHTIGVQGTASTTTSAQLSNIKFIGVHGDSTLGVRNNGQIGVLGSATAGDINSGTDHAGVYGFVNFSSASGFAGTPAGVVGESVQLGLGVFATNPWLTWKSITGVMSRGDVYIKPSFINAGNWPGSLWGPRLVMDANTNCTSTTARSQGQPCTVNADCATDRCSALKCIGGGDENDCTGSGRACYSTLPTGGGLYIEAPNRYTDETGASSCSNDTNKFHHYVWPWKLDSTYSGYVLTIDPRIPQNPQEFTSSADRWISGDHAFATLNWLSPASIVTSGGGVPSTRTLTGSTGIDIDGLDTPVDLSANRTFTFDSTEINDATWGDNTETTIDYTYNVSGSGFDPKLKLGNHSSPGVAAFDYTVPDGCLTAGDLVWRVSYNDGANGLFKMNCKGDIELADGSTISGSGLASVEFSDDIIPDTDLGYNIGSSSNRWNAINAEIFNNPGGDLILKADTTGIIQIFPSGPGATQLQFWDTGDNWTRIRALPTLAVNYTLTLPPDDGDAGEVLKTDGSGTLDWTDTAPKASALAANGANCQAGELASGTDASGAAEGCTPVTKSPVLSGRRTIWGSPKNGTANGFAVVGAEGHASSGNASAAPAAFASRFAIKYETDYGLSGDYHAGPRFGIVWLTRPAYRPDAAFTIKTGSDMTDIKGLFGVSETDQIQPMTFALTAAASTVDYAAVVMDSAVNSGKWMCCSGDGTNHDCDDMGLTATADTEYTIRVDWSTAGTLYCTVNSTTISRTANLSTAATNLFVVPVIATRDDFAEKHFYLSIWSLEMN